MALTLSFPFINVVFSKTDTARYKSVPQGKRYAFVSEES